MINGRGGSALTIARVILVLTAIFQLTALINMDRPLCAADWNEESARREAFRDIKLSIDVKGFAAFDPDYAENREAIKNRKQKVKDRFITEEPAIGGYMVSHVSQMNHPMITMAYSNSGELLTIRLFSRLEYPRKAYVYVVKGDSRYKPGQLLFVSLHVSSSEMYNFNPEGKCTAHYRF